MSWETYNILYIYLCIKLNYYHWLSHLSTDSYIIYHISYIIYEMLSNCSRTSSSLPSGNSFHHIQECHMYTNFPIDTRLQFLTVIIVSYVNFSVWQLNLFQDMDGLHIMNKCIKDLNRHDNRFHNFQRFFTFLNEGEWEILD